MGATLEQEENKVLRCQLELNAVRQEIERRLAEKEEEFILVKKAQSKALDSMQVALETETTIKKYALQVRDAQVKVDEESAAKSAAADAKATAVLLSRSSLTPTRPLLTSPTSTSPSPPPR